MLLVVPVLRRLVLLVDLVVAGLVVALAVECWAHYFRLPVRECLGVVDRYDLVQKCREGADHRRHHPHPLLGAQHLALALLGFEDCHHDRRRHRDHLHFCRCQEQDCDHRWHSHGGQ